MELRFAQVVRTASVVTGLVRGERGRSPRAPQPLPVSLGSEARRRVLGPMTSVGSLRSARDGLASPTSPIHLEQVMT